MLLKDKTILITGSSKGIGKAIARLFAAEGANLILLSRNIEATKALAAELENEYGVTVQAAQADVRNQEELKAIFNDLLLKGTILDAVVNNAGVMIDGMLQMVKDDAIKDTYETNVFGTMYSSQLAIKSFLRKRKGSIINLSSIVGTNGSAGQSVYSSSKAAIIGFTKALSKELAPLNIRVNAIAPGFIETDMTQGINEKKPVTIGMRRVGQPEDVAKVALFLASDLSDYVTGQVIGVDGGMLI
jgi:3-oxoacyl-[acyl-carrier protein] reductase